MPPKPKAKKVATTVAKERGKTAKRKSLSLSPPSDLEWISGDEEEPSMRMMMTNMGALLNTLNTRMEGFEKRQGHMESTASSHMLFAAPPEAKIFQIPDEVAALSKPMAAETNTPLPDMSNEVKAHDTRCL